MLKRSTEQWHAVSHVDELQEGELEVARLGSSRDRVLLFKLKNQVIAYQNLCPHLGWQLHDGDVDGTTLTCTQHAWEFDLTTGKGIEPGDCVLATHPCKIDDDGTVRVWAR